MIVLIGSRAARWHHPDLWPKCNDTDLIATFEDFTNWYTQNKDDIKSCFPFDKGKKFYVEFNSGDIMEWEIAHSGSTGATFLEKAEGHLMESYELEMPGKTNTVLVPTMDWLFTIKSSHKYLKDSPHFDKTMRDYHVMKHDLKCQITDKDWHKAREKATYIRPRPKLNRTKKEFFTPDVPYKYDHDTIHKAVAKYGFDDQPAYRYYMKDDAEVMSDQSKWDVLPESMKMRGAIEETYVLALERSQIPYRGEIDPIDSFKIALSKLATSISSGWFRHYVYENYYKILDMYSPEYLEWLDKGIESGVVKPFEG
jgi:hypothetical protein